MCILFLTISIFVINSFFIIGVYCVNALQLKTAWRRVEALLTKVIFVNFSILDNIYKKNCGEQLLIKEPCKLVLLISVAKFLSECKSKLYIEDMPMFWTLDDIIR